ncbi:MAG: hypothetical protein WBD07_01035 [Vicinamibacterales bacterium]
MVHFAQLPSRLSRTSQICAIAASLVFVSVSAARAQQPAAESNEQRSGQQLAGRLSEDSPSVARVTTKARFNMAAERALAPYSFPVIGVVTMFQQSSQTQPVGEPVVGYGPRFATAVADHAISAYMTTAVLPTLLHQDPRYFAAGADKGFGGRALYAASRVLVTRGESGSRQFNYSAVAGQAGAHGLSMLYNPSVDRSVSGQLTSLGFGLMLNAASNELREFWPDIRRVVFRH